jgi:hypothetical protein
MKYGILLYNRRLASCASSIDLPKAWLGSIKMHLQDRKLEPYRSVLTLTT